MADLRIGGEVPRAIYVGSTPVVAVYLGDTRLWPQQTVNISIPTNALSWTDYGPYIPAPVNIGLPTDTASWVDLTPSASSGASILAAADVLVWSDYTLEPVNGVRVSIPLDAMSWADYAQDVSTGASVSMPESSLVWSDLPPRINEFGYAFSSGFSSGFNAAPPAVDINLPADLSGWQDFSPSIAGGKIIYVPHDDVALSDFPTEAHTGASVSIPSDEQALMDYEPAIATGANIDAPSDHSVWRDFEPGIHAGVTVPIPADDTIWMDFEPAVNAVTPPYQFVASYSRTGGGVTSVSFPSVNTNVGGEFLLVCVSAAARSGADITLVSLTVNGDNVDLVVSASATTNWDAAAAIFIAPVPDASVSSIVVSTSTGTISDCAIGVYVVRDSLSVHDTAAAPLPSWGTAQNVTLDIPPDGLLFSVTAAQGSADIAVAWSGAVENYDISIPGAHSGASEGPLSSQIGRNITSTLSASSDRRAIVAISLGSAGGGASVDVPYDATLWSDYAPSAGVSVAVNVPYDWFGWSEYAPVILTGAAINVPHDILEFDDYAPTVATGAIVNLASDTLAMNDYPVATYGFSSGFSSGFRAEP